jgi:hypothetical protein
MGRGWIDVLPALRELLNIVWPSYRFLNRLSSLPRRQAREIIHTFASDITFDFSFFLLFRVIF